MPTLDYIQELVADKYVELLCAGHRLLLQAAASLAAARYLTMQGLVAPHDGKNWKSAYFAVLSPNISRFYYSVDLRSEACMYGDFLRYQRPCWHICAVREEAHR